MEKSFVSSISQAIAIIDQTYLFQYPELKAPENTPEGLKLTAHNQHIPLLLILLLPTLLFIIFLFPFATSAVEFILIFLSRGQQFLMGNISPAELTILKWEAGIFVAIFILILCLLWIIKPTEIIQLIWSSIQHLIKFDHPGELYLSHYPLKLGDSFQISYRRPLRPGVSLKKNSDLSTSLLCSKVTVTQRKTKRKSFKEIILEQPLINQKIPAGTQAIEFTIPIEIPNHGSPSIETERNRIIWEIEVNLQLESSFDTKKKKGLMGLNSRLPDSNVSTFALAVDSDA
ncbi:MAG: hypothetical protein F6K54_09490 [Okeania sp. SIO3B5]|uniref:hypothetical protein n=1 Tax=Okeania sp. SIO3B5 TaxID=2607811 RepID=UPI0013FE81D4|nr:hypothetical protein [Okeania sp. SIO3B5]NEO53291.1 hypothetical protein [Okeania sp. SIO3B5]